MALRVLSPLHKASRQLSLHLEARTHAVGVSPTEGHLLTYLRRYAPAPVGELARVFGTKQSTLTSILDRLERDGLLRRLPNPADRRSFLLRLTPKGRSLAGRLQRELVALEREIGRQVTAREQAGFEAVMAAVDAVTGVRVRER